VSTETQERTIGLTDEEAEVVSRALADLIAKQPGVLKYATSSGARTAAIADEDIARRVLRRIS
jgi:hypothetical protein